MFSSASFSPGALSGIPSTLRRPWFVPAQSCRRWNRRRRRRKPKRVARHCRGSYLPCSEMRGRLNRVYQDQGDNRHHRGSVQA